MKRTKSVLTQVTAALAVVVSLSASATAGEYSVSLASGAGVPMGDFKDAYGVNWNLNGSAEYEVTSLWGLGVDVGYHTWNGKNDYESALADSAMSYGAAPGTTVDATFNAFQYGVHGTLRPPMAGPIHPYAQAGIAGYSVKEKLDVSDPAFAVTDITKTLFGYHLGVGIEYAAAPTIGLGVDAKYHNVDTKKDFGSNATWLAIQGRVTFRIPLAK